MKLSNQKIAIDLNSPEGNAFFILAVFRKYLRQIGVEDGKIKELMADAQSSNYNHLLDVVKKNSTICFTKNY